MLDFEHIIKVGLGEIRGEWMDNKRRQVFKETFGQEPKFDANFDPKSGLAKDFIEARKLVNDAEEYNIFAELISQTVDTL